MKGLKMIAMVGLVMAAGAAWGQVDSLWSRSLTWQWGESYPHSILPSIDGDGCIISGSISGYSGVDSSFQVMLNAEGDIVWSRLYAGITTECIGTLDSGTICVGYDSWYDSNGIVIKFDKNGNIQWSRSYGNRAREVFRSIVQTTDGGYLIGGETNEFRDGWDDVLVFKINSRGDSLWSHHYGGPRHDRCHDVIETRDHGFLVTGYGVETIWTVMKLDENGDSLWASRLASSSEAIETPDGLIAIAGFKQSPIPNNWESDFWLAVLNANGELIRERTYGGVQRDQAFSMVQTSEGGFLLGGFTGSFGAGGSDIWLVRTNNRLDSLWSVTIGGVHDEMCYELLETSEKGYVIAGPGTWVVKTTPDLTSVRDPSPLTPCTLLLEPPFPNPFNSMTTIPFSVAKPGRYAVDVVDISGRLVDRISGKWRAAGSYRESWDAAGVPAGSYFVRLDAGNQLLSQRLTLVK